jgi:MFS family permease
MIEPKKTVSIARKEGSYPTWMNSLIPYGMVSGTIGTLVQLYILDLGGSVVDIGLTVTVATAVSIPAAVIWGAVSDRLKRRRPLIVGSFGAVAVLFVLFLFAHSVSEVSTLYIVYSFINSAPSTPINLLILETQAKGKWASSYANYQLLATVGNVLGLLASSIWSVFLPVSFLVVFLSGCAVIAAFVAARLISEPAFLLEGTAQVKHYSSMLQRLVTQPIVFLKTPRPIHLRNTFRILKSDFTGDLRILYALILVFYAGTGLTVVLVALLRDKGASDPLIFAATTVNLAVNAVTFRFFGSHLSRKNYVRDTVISLMVRAVAYGSIGVAAYFLTGFTFYIFLVLLFTLGSGVASTVFYITSTAMIYDSLGDADQGSALGIYTAFTSVATTLGALASGYISFYTGYYVTFLLSGISMAASAWITLRLRSTPFATG